MTAGGRVTRHRVFHLHDVFADPIVNVVINCTGNSARTLPGVEDEKCYITRGQTCLVQTPPGRVTRAIGKLGFEGILYVIPRDDGSVVLGGTHQNFNGQTDVDPKTTERILKGCVEICPELLDPVDGQLKLIGTRVGFRPTRLGGPRIEVLEKQVQGRRVYECHNYGHGGAGYQTSWASANHLVSRLLNALDVPPAKL